MKTVRDLLGDADPVRLEPPTPGDRDRLRQAVVAAASGATTESTASFRRPLAVLAAVALIVVGLVAVGSQIWSQGSATLQAAAVRFEVRLAEDRPAPGLIEAPIAGSDRIVYLHQEIVVSNGDIAQSSVVAGPDQSHFSISVLFTAAGAEKMRRATASHIGRPLAILIDGVVAAVPAVRSPVSNSALISGDFTKADAERIVNGIGLR